MKGNKLKHPSEQSWEAVGPDIVRNGVAIATASTAEEALFMAAAPDLFRAILRMIASSTAKASYEHAMYKAVGGISAMQKLAMGGSEADDEH